LKRTWPIHLLVLVGYILLSIIITWPLVLHLSTALPGEGTDSWQYLWNFWWFDQALFHGQQLYYTPAQYYPGTSLLFHTLSPLHSFLGLPARAVGGYLAAYNWVVLLSSVLSGYGVYLLVKAIGGKKGAAETETEGEEEGKAGWALELAAFLAGALYALAPYRSVHLLGHLSLIATETFPFFALFCWRALHARGRPLRDSVVAAIGIGLTWGLAVLIDWYYPLYLGLLAAFFAAWALGEALFKKRSWDQAVRAWATIAVGMVAAAILLSPLLIPVFGEAGQASIYLEEPLEFSTTYGADLAAYFLPSPLHPLWGKFFHRWTDAFAAGNTAEGIVYVGFTALVLAVVGWLKARRKATLWAGMAGLFGLFSLGPYLKVLNNRTSIPLPYLLLAELPIVRFTRVPSRYALLVQLAVSVLAGLGLHSLLRRRTLRRPAARRLTARWRGGLLATVVLALVLLEYAAMPYPLTSAEIPAFYQELAEDTRSYALLELPLQKPNSQWYYTAWMLHQTVHGKWSFRGYISRGDPLFPFGGAPLFRQIDRMAPFGDIHYDDYRDLAESVLSHYQVGYIVLERQRLEERGQLVDALALVQEALGPTGPAFEDETLIAYKVDWGAVVPFLRLGQGWHEVESQAWGPFRWIRRDLAELFVVLPEEEEVTLSFQGVSFLKPRRLEVWWGDEKAAELEIAASLQPYQFSVTLPAGETRLEWRVEGYDVPVEAGTGEDPRELSVGISELRLNP
jgi:hypothetical protein